MLMGGARYAAKPQGPPMDRTPPTARLRRPAVAGVIAIASLIVVPVAARAAEPPAAPAEKSAEDPTKIATKAGAAYSGELSASGSVAFGVKFKVNGRVAESGQWSMGASYLLPVAILTFAAGKGELDTGVEQTRYSLGGFVPLRQLGLDTGRWQLFAPFGYTYTDSRQAVTDLDQQDGIPIQVSSSSGYVGLFALRPLSERLTLMGGANFTRGTKGFSGVAAAAGLSFHLSGRDTVALRASMVDNSFGQKKRIGISYQHEF